MNKIISKKEIRELTAMILQLRPEQRQRLKDALKVGRTIYMATADIDIKQG